MLVVLAALLWLTGTVSYGVGVALVAGTVVFEGVEVWLWMKYLKRLSVKAGVEAMTGQRGTVLERCNPEGTVRIHGEIWRARCEAGAEPGEIVEVRALRGLELSVDRLAGRGEDPRTRSPSSSS